MSNNYIQWTSTCGEATNIRRYVGIQMNPDEYTKQVIPILKGSSPNQLLGFGSNACLTLSEKYRSS